jgi:cyclopropane fatty-acyl-phospholipid synthase-like methyltransferase
MFLMGLLLMGLLGLTVATAWLWVSLVLTSRRSAPYVPARSRALGAMLDLGQVGPGSRVVDLGSGDGKLVIAAAKRGASCDGIEIQRPLVWLSRVRCFPFSFAKRTRFFCQDLWTVDVAPYDVVLLYVLPSMLGRLEEKLSRELRDGGRVVSLDFPLPTWTPTLVREGVYLYER